MVRRKNLLFALLLASTALAQTAAWKTSIDGRDVAKNAQNATTDPIAIARCAYRQNEEGCPGASPELPANSTLAQVPRRMGPMGRQGPPMRGPAYPESYPASWGPQFSPGHTLIGAAIGFGLGAAAGSKNGVRSSFAAGTLVGLIGAAIGAGIPSFPGHFRRRGWDDSGWDYDEEASLRKPKRFQPRRQQPAQVVASREEPTETYQKNDFSGR